MKFISNNGSTAAALSQIARSKKAILELSGIKIPEKQTQCRESYGKFAKTSNCYRRATRVML
jgi:hypothetical protein